MFEEVSKVKPKVGGQELQLQQSQIEKERSGFFRRVYSVAKGIPEGKVMTYGQIASVLGTRDARKVGWALHGNTDLKIPCHRVVNKNGGVALNYAFSGGWREQKRRLLKEGVRFINETHVDLEKHLWHRN